MADIANVKSEWYHGYEIFRDTSGNVAGWRFGSALGITSVTTSASLVIKTHMGKIVQVTVSDSVITLPTASSATLPGGALTVLNTCDNGGQVTILCVSGDAIIGAGISTSATLANTGSTHVPGDMVTLAATGSSSWYIVGLSGTWASTS